MDILSLINLAGLIVVVVLYCRLRVEVSDLGALCSELLLSTLSKDNKNIQVIRSEEDLHDFLERITKEAAKEHKDDHKDK